MSAHAADPSPKRLLDPIDRTTEVLFGLIMALSFTCSIGAAEAGREDIRTMLIGAIGCNLAWGLVDAVIFLMTSLTERARGIATLRDLRKAASPEEARRVIEEAMPPMMARSLDPEDYERIQQKLAAFGEPPQRPRLGKADFLAAAGIFLLVFLATFPVVIPFIVMENALSALRVSNGIALVMLFLAGYSLGRVAHHRPLGMGLMMMLIGSLLVAITIALGG